MLCSTFLLTCTTGIFGGFIAAQFTALCKLIDYDKNPRETALEEAKAEAIRAAENAGAIPETIEIIDVEDVPLQYYPGNTNRVKIKAAGDLK